MVSIYCIVNKKIDIFPSTSCVCSTFYIAVGVNRFDVNYLQQFCICPFSVDTFLFNSSHNVVDHVLCRSLSHLEHYFGLLCSLQQVHIVLEMSISDCYSQKWCLTTTHPELKVSRLRSGSRFFFLFVLLESYFADHKSLH